MQSENREFTSIHVDGLQYAITPDTAAQLKKGIVPVQLRQEITKKQGLDICYEFCRQCRLSSNAMEQIDHGKLPESLIPLLQSGDVTANILFMLTNHKLIEKAEKLYRRRLISLKVLDTVRKEYLTSEILPDLKQAFLIDTARFLYKENEISEEILDKVKSGEIGYKFILTIRRSHRHLLYLNEHEMEYGIYEHPDGNPVIDNYGDPSTDPEHTFTAMLIHWYLEEAFKWLTPEDYRLIQDIFYEEIPMVKIAAKLGVSEGTIRHRKKKVLKQLRRILVDILSFPYELLY